MAPKTIDVNGTTVEASETSTTTTTTLEQVASTSPTFTEIKPLVSTLSYDQVNSLEMDTGFTVPADQFLTSVMITYTIDNVVETLSVFNNSTTTEQTLKEFDLLLKDTTYDPNGVKATGTTPDASAINNALPSYPFGALLYQIGATTFQPSQVINYIGNGGSDPVSTIDGATVTAKNPSAYLGSNFYTINYSTLTSEQISGGGGNIGFSGTVKSSSSIDVKYNFEAVCFLRGTHILTDRGEVAVETLRPGDWVVTLSGQGAVLKPVRWIGRRHIDIARHPTPDLVRPIRIRAGAFGEALPRRDLLVSRGHAMFFDGRLIPACHLVNGATVIQDDSLAATVEYFHVELDAHDLVLAEGMPSESYIDCGNRGFFTNAEGVAPMLHGVPDAHVHDDGETPIGYCAPLATRGELVRAVRRRLQERLLAMGWRPLAKAGADIHLLADGVRIAPSDVSGETYRFVLPRNTTQLWLMSRPGVPAWNDCSDDDFRRLGIAVGSITWRDGANGMPVTLTPDDERLVEGWHYLERYPDGRPFRWTDGRGRLPALATGELMVEIGQVLTGWQPPGEAAEGASCGVRLVA